ncbi:hypothetical protein OC861_006240 [Tilletia horrida]|nr:hypothetical protein OC861_006240 [Tilletia horrida]
MVDTRGPSSQRVTPDSSSRRSLPALSIAEGTFRESTLLQHYPLVTSSAAHSPHQHSQPFVHWHTLPPRPPSAHPTLIPGLSDSSQCNVPVQSGPQTQHVFRTPLQDLYPSQRPPIHVPPFDAATLPPYHPSAQFTLPVPFQQYLPPITQWDVRPHATVSPPPTLPSSTAAMLRSPQAISRVHNDVPSSVLPHARSAGALRADGHPTTPGIDDQPRRDGIDDQPRRDEDNEGHEADLDGDDVVNWDPDFQTKTGASGQMVLDSTCSSDSDDQAYESHAETTDEETAVVLQRLRAVDADNELEDLAEEAAGRAGTKQARPPSTSKSRVYSALANQDIQTLKLAIDRACKKVAEKHDLSTSKIRQRVGFGFKSRRAISDYNRFQRWHSHNKRNPAPGDLALRASRVAEDWTATSQDPTARRRIMQRVKEWEQSEAIFGDATTARQAMRKFDNEAIKLASQAYEYHGISSVTFAVHPHTMTTSAYIGVPSARKHFERALARAEDVDHLRKNFQARVYATPSGTAASPSERASLERGSSTQVKRSAALGKNVTWRMIKESVPPMLQRLVDDAYAATERDIVSWYKATGRSANLKSDHVQVQGHMAYLRLFDILSESGLQLEGWPSALRGYLSDDAVFLEVPSTGGAPTLTITAGSLHHWNEWSKPLGHILRTALIDKQLRIVPTPVEGDGLGYPTSPASSLVPGRFAV